MAAKNQIGESYKRLVRAPLTAEDKIRLGDQWAELERNRDREQKALDAVRAEFKETFGKIDKQIHGVRGMLNTGKKAIEAEVIEILNAEENVVEIHCPMFPRGHDCRIVDTRPAALLDQVDEQSQEITAGEAEQILEAAEAQVEEKKPKGKGKKGKGEKAPTGQSEWEEARESELEALPESVSAAGKKNKGKNAKGNGAASVAGADLDWDNADTPLNQRMDV